jgi:hypothetical protein
MADGELGGSLRPNPLVESAKGPMTGPLKPAKGKAADAEKLAAQIGGTASSDRVCFLGYLGKEIAHRDTNWTVLYIDWEQSSWLLIETSGIVARETIPNYTGMGSPQDTDVVWVMSDAAVGLSRKTLSLEGMFLTGTFTRAGDFEGTVGGGTVAASTGVFCEARSPGCCRGKTPRT